MSHHCFLFVIIIIDQSSELFEKSLQDGYLNLSAASIMFVGTDHAGCTSAKHLVFQESVPTTLQPTQLVKHEIYFRAKEDPTLRKVQPDNYDQIVYYSLSFGEIGGVEETINLSAFHKKPVPSAKTSTKPAATETSPEESSKSAASTPTSGTPTTQSTSGMSESLAESYQQSVNLKRIIEECASMDDFKKLLIKYNSAGKIDFFHSFDCGSSFLQMREILKIFIKNVSLCTLVADCSKGLHQNEIGMLQESESFALRGLVIGSHCDLMSSTMKPPNELTECFGVRDFVIKNVDKDIFPINCANPQVPDHTTAANIIDQQLCSLAVTKRFPFSWYLFGFRLLQAMTGTDTLSVSQDCMVIAKNLKMDRPTVEAALEHLTEQNLILYFRDILSDVVFSGVNFFSQFFSYLLNTISQRKDAELQNVAIIKESDLNDIVLTFKHTAHNMSLANYFTLFMKLQILAPYNGAYLITCLLPILGESDINRNHSQKSSLSAPLIVKCPSIGYEFICMLVIFLLTQTNGDWNVLDASGAPVILFKNCIKFIVLSSGYVVVISFSSGYLKVTVEHPEQETQFLWKVGNIILKGLEMSKIILSCHKAFEFKLSFQCPCGIPDHTATYDQDRDSVICDESSNEVSPSHYKKWIHAGMFYVEESR